MQRQVDDVARKLGPRRAADRRRRVLGPAPAPLAILRGRHRRRFLVKASRAADLAGQPLSGWLDRVQVPGAVRLTVDIDPYSFL